LPTNVRSGPAQGQAPEAPATDANAEAKPVEADKADKAADKAEPDKGKSE
jgi:hypothetical protein